uniref:Tyrosine-protein phosphatase non-receptor type n=1 Tax=Xenopus tropicalis TaxID=8364 RepID=A0A6I8QX10_XENTR
MPNVSFFRWLHPNLTGQEAEIVLKSRGVHGSFLVRHSKKKTEDFSLSVRVKDSVTHIRIRYTGDYYDLYGGKPFVSLSGLVEFYTGQANLQDTSGNRIELKYPLNCSDPTNERWYHGYLSGPDAEKLLQKTGEPWTFLVRESRSNPGDFVISILTPEQKDGVHKVTHVKINTEKNKDTYNIGREKFESLTDLIEWHKKKPIEEATGSHLFLKKPCYSTRVNAADIENRMKELNKKSEQDEAAKAGFWEEFDALQKQENKVHNDRKEGQRPENKSKNRYKNILPYDHTRVILKCGDNNTPGSDYINANYVNNLLWAEGEPPKRFIACQGCLNSTTGDFWEMVWQENSRVIVMTTKEIEKGRTKCVPYWPDVGTNMKEFGRFLVQLMSERDTKEYKVRLLRVSLTESTEKSRDIHHYQYLTWPDHGVPADPGGVLSFLEEVNSMQESMPRAGAIVVHCSAGIGRTGTIIAIDMLLDLIQMKGVDSDIDVQKTIQMVRNQRSGMVQTEAQYKFIYSAIAQFIDSTKHKLKAMENRNATESEYGNLGASLTKPKVTRSSSKNQPEGTVYENLNAGKQKEEVVKKKSSEKQRSSVKKK